MNFVKIDVELAKLQAIQQMKIQGPQQKGKGKVNKQLDLYSMNIGVPSPSLKTPYAVNIGYSSKRSLKLTPRFSKPLFEDNKTPKSTVS